MKSLWRGLLPGFGRLGLVLSVAALAVAACGGGTDRTKAHVRLVNASSGYSALNLVIDGSTITSAAAYGETAGYNDASRGTQVLDVSSPSSATVLSSREASLGKDSYHTLLAYGRAGALSTVLLDDNVSAPASGKTQLRVLNAAPDAGAVDIYITAAGDTLAQSTAVQTSLAYGTVGSFVTLNSGTWRLRVTGAANKDDLRLDVSGLVFDSKGVQTLVLSAGRGGVLVNGLLLAQQGGIASAANTQARVRAVGGVGSNASVTATVAGTSLLSSTAAPALTGYTLVPAGTAAITAQANGTAAALNSATLAGGADYTLLVYGTPGAPRAALIEDNNTLPSDSTRAKLRLVHGVAGVGGTVSLKVDLQVSASAVAAGAASSYALTAASTTAQLDARSSDGLLTPYISSNRTLLANAVYTLFLVGDANAPVGALNRDR